MRLIRSEDVDFADPATKEHAREVVKHIMAERALGSVLFLKEIGFGEADKERWKIDTWMDDRRGTLNDRALFYRIIEYIDAHYPHFLLQINSKKKATKSGAHISYFFADFENKSSFEPYIKSKMHQISGLYATESVWSHSGYQGSPRHADCFWLVPLISEMFFIVHRFEYVQLTAKEIAYLKTNGTPGGSDALIRHRRSGFGFVRDWGLVSILRSSARPDQSFLESWNFENQTLMSTRSIYLDANYHGVEISEDKIRYEKMNTDERYVSDRVETT